MSALGFALCVLCMYLVACSKPSGDSASVAPTSSTAASAAPIVDAGPFTITWKGSYEASPASLYVPDGGEWAGTKWRGDDAGDGIGSGTVMLTVLGSHVDGTVDGVLGPAVVDGSFFGDHLSASIRRKDPTDRGFVGVLDGIVKDDKFDGEIHVSSLVNANLLRQAKLELTPSH
ncbi:MAG: hypothetical protein ACRELY_15560 [Polyangiaceae bacterium]